jgi:hypothetical protein
MLKYRFPQPPILHVQHLEAPFQLQLVEFWPEIFSSDCQTRHIALHHPVIGT